MSEYRIFGHPQSSSEAVDVLDKVNCLLQFVVDLTCQPSPPISEYDFSEDGFAGLAYFLMFVQDTIVDCKDAIHKKV